MSTSYPPACWTAKDGPSTQVCAFSESQLEFYAAAGFSLANACPCMGSFEG